MHKDVYKRQAYSRAKPLCDKRGESAERFGNVCAAHSNPAEVFRREGSGAENAERIGQAIVHAARCSIKVCVGGILRDAVAQQDVCASRCRITGQNTFCPVEKEGMVCQQQILSLIHI